VKITTKKQLYIIECEKQIYFVAKKQPLYYGYNIQPEKLNKLLISLLFKGRAIGDSRYENDSYFVARISHRHVDAKKKATF